MESKQIILHTEGQSPLVFCTKREPEFYTNPEGLSLLSTFFTFSTQMLHVQFPFLFTLLFDQSLMCTSRKLLIVSRVTLQAVLVSAVWQKKTPTKFTVSLMRFYEGIVFSVSKKSFDACLSTAKQGENALGSVRLSVCMSKLSCLGARLCRVQQRAKRSHYQSKMFVCVSTYCADAVDWLLLNIS